MNRILFAFLSLSLLAALSCGASQAETMTVYKTPTCGCCSGYVAALQDEGYTVKAIDLEDVSGIKEQNGVPRRVWDCHTTLVGNYFIEGHVPLAAVAKLLSEKPDIAGIALPNMPVGTPGMPGPKKGPFVVLQIAKDGTISEYASY